MSGTLYDTKDIQEVNLYSALLLYATINIIIIMYHDFLPPTMEG